MTEKKEIKTNIIKSWLCEKCGFETKTSEEYKQHKIDHNLGKEFKTIHPVTGEAIGEEVAENPPVQATVVPQEGSKDEKPTIVPSKQNPVILHYKYTGKCESCGSDIQTIEVVLENYNICVAYCEKEQKQILQQKVIPITTQIKDK